MDKELSVVSSNMYIVQMQLECIVTCSMYSYPRINKAGLLTPLEYSVHFNGAYIGGQKRFLNKPTSC